MPRRPQEDPWWLHSNAKPLPVENGLASSKQRGAMASEWWSKRFVEVLESYGLGGRMQRGRRYARKGQVVSLAVQPGVLAASVQGSRPAPYEVTITFTPPTAKQWTTIEKAMSAK